MLPMKGAKNQAAMFVTRVPMSKAVARASPTDRMFKLVPMAWRSRSS